MTAPRPWKAGDRALHRYRDLDPRTVVRAFDIDGVPHITLNIGGGESCPMLADNYVRLSPENVS